METCFSDVGIHIKHLYRIATPLPVLTGCRAVWGKAFTVIHQCVYIWSQVRRNAAKMKVLLQQVDQPVQLDDPSEYRPELEFVPAKEKDNFRVFAVSASDLRCQ